MSRGHPGQIKVKINNFKVKNDRPYSELSVYKSHNLNSTGPSLVVSICHMAFAFIQIHFNGLRVTSH